MAVVILSVRDQDGQSLLLIDGIPFTASLQTQSGLIVQQQVDRFASLTIGDIPPNQYVALVHHPSVQPNTAFFNFEVVTGNEIVLVLFVYLEPERNLFDITCVIEP